MSGPRTEAGRRLFGRLWAVNEYAEASRIIAGVEGNLAAIEAEAIAAYRAELAAKVRALPFSEVVAWYPMDATGPAVSRDDVLRLIEGEQ